MLILDAVVRGWDKSETSLRAWRNLRAQPLRREIKNDTSRFPTPSALLLGHKLGIRLSINDVARELAQVWDRQQPGQYSEQTVLAAITRFLPLDQELDPKATVRVAFEKARSVVGEHAGRQRP